MRMSLLLRLVLTAATATLLVGAQPRQQRASINDLTGSDQQQKDKVVAGLELSLLSLLGFSKRPKPVRIAGKQAHVPDQLRQLYLKQRKMDAVDVAKAGIHAGNSNTVRAFTHIGEFWNFVLLYLNYREFLFRYRGLVEGKINK